jgi:hypothetical protein
MAIGGQRVDGIAAIEGPLNETPAGLRMWEMYFSDEGGKRNLVVRSAAGKQVVPEGDEPALLSEYLRFARSKVTFARDDDSGEVIIRVVDMVSGEVLRQVPPEEVRTLALKVSRNLGLLVDRRQ